MYSNHAPEVTLQPLTAGDCAQLKKALIAFFSARSYKEGRRARACLQLYVRASREHMFDENVSNVAIQTAFIVNTNGTEVIATMGHERSKQFRSLMDGVGRSLRVMKTLTSEDS